jgi:tRNA uridine 5-carboxymethylaminomethyl modification enzyme
MMTARAEFRLHLRADNASTRLGPAAIAADCISPRRRACIEERAAECASATRLLDERVSAVDLGGDCSERRPLRDWLLRPEFHHAVTVRLAEAPAAEEVIADAEYRPYLERQRKEWDAMCRDTSVKFPACFDFQTIPGISTEMVERLAAARPETLGQAARIRGITPAALSALHFALARAA